MSAKAENRPRAPLDVSLFALTARWPSGQNNKAAASLSGAKTLDKKWLSEKRSPAKERKPHSWLSCSVLPLQPNAGRGGNIPAAYGRHCHPCSVSNLLYKPTH